MTEDGVFRAGEEEGDYTVTATSGLTKTTVRIAVQRKKIGPVEKPEPPPVNPGIKWSGQVPPQKWMNFYTKVLAKFVNSGSLTVRVDVGINPQGGLSPQQIEEFKAALRELGLDSKADA
jgi:hypothetical protein